jgi:hypothetical protein
MKHEHKAIANASKDKGWTTCVTPQECAAHPQRQDAHGNIVRLDTCQCGATRESEINGSRTNYGAWKGEMTKQEVQEIVESDREVTTEEALEMFRVVFGREHDANVDGAPYSMVCMELGY